MADKKTNNVEELTRLYGKLPKSPIPAEIKPMLATLVESAPADNDWIYEIKWDGFRAMAYLDENKTDLRSRNNKNFNDKFYPVYTALKASGIRAVLDGEIIAVTGKGVADFSALQTWRSEADGELVFYVFDVLWYEGFSLLKLPLYQRKELLKKILPEKGIIRYSETFEGSGKDLFELAEKMHLEGIIAKNRNSIYMPDVRSKSWLKIKSQKSQELVIGGYTKNENTSKPFSSLLTGIWENGRFIFITPVGTGFTVKQQKEIIEKLRPLETSDCPFAEVPDYNKPTRFRPDPPRAEVIWVRPEVVAEVTFRTVAPDGSVRHPSFKGLREDKSAGEIIREVPLEQELYDYSENRKLLITTEEKSERKTFLNPKEETQVRHISGHDLKFPNLSKVFWPEERWTKRDLLNYYYQIAPYILPYITDRPQTLNRFPNGIYHESFYQKDVTKKAPSWITTYPYYSWTDQREKQFLVCTDEASLLYIASLGCIEINPWSSRTVSPDNPDWCIIDLDPDQNTFEEVIVAAQVTRQILQSVGIESCCKTSGSTGLHIYIPLEAKYSYEESKEFGRAVAKAVNREIPGFTTVERYTSKRNGKMYIDFLQNRPQATVAAPYSVRPKPGAPVSMPVAWEEVKKGLRPDSFNLRNAVARVRETGDLFGKVLGKGSDIEKARSILVPA
jgi:bifunctional non-homologous end joining protein LigD